MVFNIFITGDYCPIGRNSLAIDQGDFSMIKAIAPFALKADLAITNLEAPITSSNTKLNKSGPNIKVNKNSLAPLKESGFSLVTLANNHILDYGTQGIKETLDHCFFNGIDTIGAGLNLKKAKTPYIFEKGEKKIGIINIAENEFCSAKENSAGANPVNLIQNHQAIKNLKKQVDYVLIIAHGGREHYQIPTPKIRERYRFYVESGANAVIGHHPHCFSGYEIYNEAPIFYSLGNFLFDYKTKYQKGPWTQGYGVNIKINNDIIDFEIIPFHQGRAENPNLILFDDIEKENFFKEIEELNSIITDDILFFESWSKYLKTQEVSYKGLLFIQNKYIRAAINKGFLPKWFFHSKEHKTLLLNLFRCETHKEIMTAILEKNNL